MALFMRWPLKLLVLFPFLMLCACATQPKLSDLNAEQKARMARILVFSTEGLPPGSYQKISTVETIACKKSFVEKNEVSKLKIQAAKLDADAVINLKFQEKDELDWAHDCWSTVVGIGDAVRITNSGATAAKPSKE